MKFSKKKVGATSKKVGKKNTLVLGCAENVPVFKICFLTKFAIRCCCFGKAGICWQSCTGASSWRGFGRGCRSDGRSNLTTFLESQRINTFQPFVSRFQTEMKKNSKILKQKKFSSTPRSRLPNEKTVFTAQRQVHFKFFVFSQKVFLRFSACATDFLEISKNKLFQFRWAEGTKHRSSFLH